MQVFKCALKVVFRRPVYFLIYGVWLSFMSVFMANSMAAGAGDTQEYEPYEVEYAVIDRDGSDVSAGVADFLATLGQRVEIEDSQLALQEAAAKGAVDYVLIIPKNYGSEFVRAVRSGENLPEMDCVYSYYSAEGALVDTALANYLGALQTCALAFPDENAAELSALALDETSAAANVSLAADAETSEASDQFTFYMQFDMYIYFTGITVCVSLMLAALNRADIRRRNLASPLSYASRNLQTVLACLVVMAVFWALSFAVGIACFPASFAAISTAGKLLMAAISLVFVCVPLSVAFLLGQIGVSDTAANAVGNILGLVLSFLGGVWVPLEVVAPEIDVLAHFLPGYWYTDAMAQAADVADFGAAQTGAILADMGVIALFAVTIFAVAMVVGRAHTQTSEAGGNAAAEVVAA